MSKKDTNSDGADRMPSSVTEVAVIVREFMEKHRAIKREIETLKEDEKNLFEEFSKKMDTKTFKAALRAVSIKEKVVHKDTFDTFVEALERVDE